MQPSSLQIYLNLKVSRTAPINLSQPEGVEHDASIKPPNLSQPEAVENDAAIKPPNLS